MYAAIKKAEAVRREGGGRGGEGGEGVLCTVLITKSEISTGEGEGEGTRGGRGGPWWWWVHERLNGKEDDEDEEEVGWEPKGQFGERMYVPGVAAVHSGGAMRRRCAWRASHGVSLPLLPRLTQSLPHYCPSPSLSTKAKPEK